MTLSTYLLFLTVIRCREINITETISHKHWRGLKCRVGSKYPSSCPNNVPSCIANSSCLMWEHGRFNLTALKYGVKVLPSCDATSAPGSWHGRQWVPKSSCYPGWQTPGQMLARLQNKTVVFSGDSMVRQLFHRLIWYLRGIPDVIEHYTHYDAFYQIVGDTDEFLLHSHRPAANASVVLHFVWGPRTIAVQKLIDLRAPFYVVGPMYWRDDNMSEVPAILDRLYDISNRIFWVATPAKGGKYVASDYKHYAPRNANFRQWASKRPGTSVLPMDSLEHNPNFSCLRADGHTHFQCAVNAQYGPIGYGRYSIPSDGHCQDIFNLNVLQLFVNAL